MSPRTERQRPSALSALQNLSVRLRDLTEKAMAPHSSTLAGKSHGRRSLVGCTPWGREESDTTERLHFHFSLSCIGEGNGNPLQCSCLENPGDGGAWWAAVYGVVQSQTRLKRLSSSGSSSTEVNTTSAMMICRLCVFKLHYDCHRSKKNHSSSWLPRPNCYKYLA